MGPFNDCISDFPQSSRFVGVSLLSALLNPCFIALSVADEVDEVLFFRLLPGTVGVVLTPPLLEKFKRLGTTLLDLVRARL